MFSRTHKLHNLGLDVLIIASFSIWTTTGQNSSVYEWETGRWESCVTRSGCGEGLRERMVDCVAMDGGMVVPDSNCDLLQKPPTTESCFHVCERLKPYLRWFVSPWSKCKPRKDRGFSCSSPGVSSRFLHCRYADADGLKIVPDSACERFSNKPENSMSCSYECPQDCIIAEEACQGKDICSSTKQGYRVIVAPEAGGATCPPSNACIGDSCFTKSENRSQYTLKVGDWRPCSSENSRESEFHNSTALSLEPEIGRTTRNISCLENNGRKVNLSYCSKVDVVQQQRCLVPKNCELSPWSEWRVTVEGCINSRQQILPETRFRSRFLVLPALGNGKSCGPLFEERIVRTGLMPCSKYEWFPLEWTECAVYQHKDMSKVEVLRPTCGGGVQVRKIICRKITDFVPVQEFLCAEPKPPSVQRCVLSCIRNCQVSHWSKWGPCLPFDNVTNFNKSVPTGYRKRTRSVVVNPSSGGSDCPHLEEADLCSDVSVAEWIYGNWSDCRLLDRSSRCGPGEKTRDYSCVTFKGSPISELFCEKHAIYRRTTEACRVPCSDDCILSEWSEWARCPISCSDDNEETRIHRNRTILAMKGADGSSCHGDKKESKACDRHGCSLTRWLTSAWHNCEFIQNSSSCGEGIQTRRVYCQRGDARQLDDSSCGNLQKPTNRRTCFKECPQDCLLTNFTEWTPCPSTCNSKFSQRRSRFVLKSAAHGGLPCPLSFTEERICPAENDVVCTVQKDEVYRWLTDSWSACILPSINNSCGTGFQVRSISCIDDHENPVDMHRCLSKERPVQDSWSLVRAVPAAFRLCQVTCHDERPSCVHSAWTPWSSCPHKYKAKRVRTRELVGLSARDPFCVERFILTEQEDCPLLDDELSVIQTPWFSCILEDSNRSSVAVNSESVLHYCGAGYRYKIGLQVKEVDAIEPGLERDLCLIDCPVDCVMSEWSEWSACDVPCGQGYRQRKRKITVPSNGFGRPCPNGCVNGTETEQDVCEVPCREYRWLAHGWSKCELTAKDATYKKCGNGTQIRKIQCVHERIEDAIDPSHCDPLLKPDNFGLCEIACPGECIVSHWTISKPCTQPCRTDKFVEKRRTVLRHPAAPNLCPELMASDPCVLNSNCFEHYWQFGEWASCTLPEGAICGEGIQKRALLCRRSDGRQVDTINCKMIEESPSLKHELSKPCLLDCPVDCVLSSWSKWKNTQCSHHCGTTGMMTRNRYVLQPSSECGQPCPSEMEQKKPCPFKPCFHWKTFDWSECDLQGASCGYGVKRRLVSCIRYDGLQVDKAHCLASNLTFEMKGWLDAKWLTLAHDKAEEQDCYVRCPGDCILSEWTAWGNCHKDCQGGQTVGYQTSSRVLLAAASSPHSHCPSKTWRTKPCWESQCTSFKWKYKNDTLMCLSSEGGIVKGGCNNLPRPCFRTCESLPGGKCNPQKGTCYCQSSNGRLVPISSASLGRRKCDYPPPKAISSGPRRPANHTLEIHRKYYPDDSQVSFWMYAMISIGSAFVIFVVVTIYLMCSNGGQST